MPLKPDSKDKRNLIKIYNELKNSMSQCKIPDYKTILVSNIIAYIVTTWLSDWPSMDWFGCHNHIVSVVLCLWVTRMPPGFWWIETQVSLLPLTQHSHHKLEQYVYQYVIQRKNKKSETLMQFSKEQQGEEKVQTIRVVLFCHLPVCRLNPIFIHIPLQPCTINTVNSTLLLILDNSLYAHVYDHRCVCVCIYVLCMCGYVTCMQ